MAYARVMRAVVGDLERVRAQDLQRLVESLFIHLRMGITAIALGGRLA
jgi:hypothetical protein